eukprot:gene35325-56810_t
MMRAAVRGGARRAAAAPQRRFSSPTTVADAPLQVACLSAGNAALPLEVLQRAQKELVNWQGKAISVQEGCEAKFRELLNIPDTHEVFFLNGGATLQFSAPCNPARPLTCNYVMNGHWSEKASREADLYCRVNRVCVDPKGMYFTLPEPETWDIDPEGRYLHYTSADTRQGFQFIDFPYHVVPKGMLLCSDQSADLGSKPID